MKKILIFISVLTLLSVMSYAQQITPTLDGTLDSGYALLYSTTANARTGFGSANDCSAIYYAYDANSVYFFVQGQIDGTGNGLILMIGSSATSGFPAGYNLGNTNSGNGVFSLGAGSNGDWEMDFPVSIGIEVNAFGGTVPSNGNYFYVNDAVYLNTLGSQSSGYIGHIAANGAVVTAPGVSGVSGAIVSYNNSGNSSGPGSSTGLEVALPLSGSALGNITQAVTLQAFAIIVSSTGYFSNDGVPTNFPNGSADGGGNWGNTPNFGSAGAENPGPNHVSITGVPVELSKFSAE